MKNIYYAACLAIAVFAFSSCDKFNGNIAPPNQELTFFKYYGHVYTQTAADVAQIALDGGYLVFGSTTSFNSEGDRGLYNNFYVVRTDSLGNEIWSRSYGASGYDQIARRVIVLPEDGGFLLAGTRQRIDFSTGQAIRAEKRVHLIKIDMEGAVIEEGILPDAGNNPTGANFDYELSDIKMLPDGNFVFTGTTTNVNTNKPAYNALTDRTDIYTVRLFNNTITNIAPPAWQAAYGFNGNDFGVAIHPSRNGLIITGTTETYEGNDSQLEFIVVKYVQDFPGISNQGVFGDIGTNLVAADACYDSLAGVLTIIGNERISISTGGEQVGRLAFMQIDVPNVSNTVSRKSITTPCIYTNGSPEKAGSGSQAASILLLPENAGYLVTSTSVRIAGINNDMHVLRITPQLQVQWDWLFGTGRTLEKAAKAIPVLKGAPDGPQTLGGYAFTGTFDFGGGNTMIGLIKTNSNGALSTDIGDE